MKSKSLYIHIPFCSHLCYYCDFTKIIYNQKYAHQYVLALIAELELLNIPQKSLETIYIGGGTPTSLSNEDLELLLQKIQFLIAPDCEFSLEANIENFTRQKGELLRKYRVNRLSFGVQTFDNHLLNSIGRKHTAENVIAAINLAKEMGFNNLNIDLIYGLPTQTIAMFKDDLQKAVALDIDHISTYSLTVSPNTVFYNQKVKVLDDEYDRQFYDILVSYLRSQGYVRYEVSNFARHGAYSKHNLTYWRNEHYYGIGLGAHGYIEDIRYMNTKNLSKYLKGESRFREEIVTPQDLLEYEFMLKLRTHEGINHQQFFAKFQKRLNVDYKDVYNKMCQRNLLFDNGVAVVATDEGIALLDSLILEFMK